MGSLTDKSDDKGKSQVNSAGRDALRALVDKWDEKSSLRAQKVTILDAAIAQLRNGPQAHVGIKQFLQSKGCKIDDCFRWHLLHEAVNIVQDVAIQPEELNARVEISKIIIEARPCLAFENPSRGEAVITFKRQCVSPNLHSAIKVKATPFYLAARCGIAKVIESMISNANDPAGESLPGYRLTNKNMQLLKLVQERDIETKSTALELAVKAEQRSLETIEELLKVDGIATQDKSFTYAIDEGFPEVVDKFLDHKNLAEIFVTSDRIIHAMEKIDQPTRRQTNREEYLDKDEAKAHRRKIVESLVRRATSPDIFNEQLVVTIIKKDMMNAWEAIPNNALTEDLKSCLLHLAVFYQKCEFVKLFVKEYPESVMEKRHLRIPGFTERDRTEQYPLWYNNYQWSASKGFARLEEADKKRSKRAEIRTIIVTTMIHAVRSIEKLSEIFHESNEPFGDLGLDMSRVNLATYGVSTFVDSLIQQNKSRKLLSFEQTLRYVEFPPLDMMVGDREMFKENSYFDHGHTEVFKILDWLKERDVKSIIKLKVPDRLVNPHDDLEMAERLDDFKVEILDWKVLDLSISTFKQDTKNRIRELHLYSSGKRAVVSHWFSQEGINSLPKLETLEIKVIKETCTKEYSNKLCYDIEKELNKFQTTKPTIRAQVEKVPWYPKPKFAALDDIARQVAPKLAGWLDDLDAVIKRRKIEKGIHHRPTRVAILDNGILSVSPVPHVATEDSVPGRGKEHQSGDTQSAWSRIQDGQSFVNGDSRLSSWMFASDPHGTQMANLICAIDPFCEIYIARVAEDSFGIKPDRVANAIEWARSKQVDVISMSFVMHETSNKLINQINKATEDGIIMTCSTHDEGSRIVDAYPASHMGDTVSLIVLAACDEYGKLLREVDASKYHYMIRGQNVAAGTIPFLRSEDTITGSSVATALAAGLCSLILTCDRVATPDKEYETGVETDKSRLALVKKHLDVMKSSTGSKHVLPEKFCNIDPPRIGQSDPKGQRAITVLRQWFGMK